MSVWSWISRKSNAIWKREKSDPNRDLSAVLTSGAYAGPFTSAWTDHRIEQSRHFKHWVYIAISRIADKIACQTPNVGSLSTVSSTQSNHFSSFLKRNKALTPLGNHQDLVHVRNEHPLLRLLNDPNDPDTSFDLWYETLLFLLLEGSAYWWIPKNPLGLPSAIWVLPSHWVWPIAGKERLIESYELRPTDGLYLRKNIPAEEIIHFRRKNPLSKIDGYSPMTAGAQWLAVYHKPKPCRTLPTLKHG